MTTVRIDFFKHTGKWYSSFGFNTYYPCFETAELIRRAEQDERFIKDMSFIITAVEDKASNKRLIIKQP
ncbi:MAG: hypothetical protein WD512_16805 [Candidatus Paceibacterota bacterium]